LKRQNARHLEQIERLVATTEAAILEIVEADACLADRFAILSSKGVSNVTAFDRTPIGTLGWARRHSRVRASARETLHMSVLVATCLNPD
jgi:hypothetical protein